MREKIGKALKTRAEAIRHALEEYNICATALTPPRPPLAWHDIMEMASLAEFDLLRDAREDIREYAWAKRLNRQAMNMHFNIQRAREEIERLNVELPRLFTSLVDRHFDLKKAMASVADTDPALAYELEQRWQYEDRISARITARLYATTQLKGFSGSLATGRRVGRDTQGFDGFMLPTWACRPAGGGDTAYGARAGGGGGRDDDPSRAHDDGETAHGEHDGEGDRGFDSDGRAYSERVGGVAPGDDSADGPGDSEGGMPGLDSIRDTLKLVDFIDALA